MLQALLQTLANLGFDAQSVNNSFNEVLNTIRGGDTSSLEGIFGVFNNVISVVTGVDSADVSMIIASLVTSIIEVFSNVGGSGILSTITGA
ncbi:MAG: hypothetical protein J1E34_01945 [Oscillospiraceae bacterium]|nr:hypothetical protein [Oscillospiraceae bacterium]